MVSSPHGSPFYVVSRAAEEAPMLSLDDAVGLHINATVGSFTTYAFASTPRATHLAVRECRNRARTILRR